MHREHSNYSPQEESHFVIGESMKDDTPYIVSIRKASIQSPITKPVVRTFSDDEPINGTFHFQVHENGTQHNVTIEIINIVYSFWSSLVFALMSFFRAKGSDNFDNLTWDTFMRGMGYALCSLCVNFPMGYFFSHAAFKEIKKVWGTKSNIYLKFSFFPALFLGLSTTGAGIAISSLSLQQWAPQWFAIPTMFVFSWNTLTTRTISSTGMLYSFLCNNAQFLMRRCSRRFKKYEPIFQFLDDLNRYGLKVNKISYRSTESPNKFKDCIEDFYRSLEQQGITTDYSVGEITGKIFHELTKALLFMLALDSIALWLGLTEKGLNTLSDHWGEITSITWLCSLSHVGLYGRSAIQAPGIIEKVYRHFDGTHFLKRLGQTALTLAPFLILGWFSGAGYSETAQDMSANGYGRVANETLFESSSPFAQVYQYQYNWLGPDFFNSVYFFLMSGMVVNGINAFRGFLNHTPKRIQRYLPSLFGQSQNALNSITCSELEEEIKSLLFNHDATALDEIVTQVDVSRRLWINGFREPVHQFLI